MKKGIFTKNYFASVRKLYEQREQDTVLGRSISSLVYSNLTSIKIAIHSYIS